MKRKKINKKLALNKETIANMDSAQMDGAKGGLNMGTIFCPDTYECPPYTQDPTYQCTFTAQTNCTAEPTLCTGDPICTLHTICPH